MWNGKHSIHSAAAQAEDEGRSWGQLDINLLTAILCCLKTDNSPTPAALKDMIAATGVCQHWRNVGSALFFCGSSWQGQSTIRHPRQLVTLCPLSKAPGGLIRGQIRRVKSGWTLTGRRQRLLFYQSLLSPTGHTVPSGKFLLAAEQRASGSWAVFMNRGCKGEPVAVLSSNALRTMYTLTAVAQGDSTAASSSSSSSSNLLQRSSSLAATSYSSSSSLERYGSTQLQEGDPAAAAAAAADAKVVMSLHYKLHLKAMVLPRRMSVCLQVPSQHTQRSLCTNSRTGQPTAAWQTPNVQLQHLQLQQQEQEQEQPNDDIPAVQSEEVEDAAADDAGVAAGGDSFAVGEVLPAVGEPVAAPVLQKLENKQPHWNGALRVWCLNFNGRVKLSSAKNFQLVSAPTQQTQPPQPGAADNAMQPQAPQAEGTNPNNSMAGSDAAASATLPSSPGTGGIVVQFGKTEPHAFILDYDPCVTTALQAFAVALTTFGTKLLA